MILNTSSSSSSIFQGSFDGKNLQKSGSQRGLNIKKISTLQKNQSELVLPKIRQQIQNSYNDPYKEERFVEKDLSYYKIQKYNKNGLKRIENNYSSGKGLNSEIPQLNSVNQTPRGFAGGSSSKHNDKMETPIHFRLKTNNDYSPIGQSQRVNSTSNSSQIMITVNDITQNYNSALAQKSKNLIMNSNTPVTLRINQNINNQIGQRKQSLSEKIEEDCKVNKNMQIIRNILMSDNRPLVCESYSTKFQKYYIGHRVPTYFHKVKN